MFECWSSVCLFADSIHRRATIVCGMYRSMMALSLYMYIVRHVLETDVAMYLLYGYCSFWAKKKFRYVFQCVWSAQLSKHFFVVLVVIIRTIVAGCSCYRFVCLHREHTNTHTQRTTECAIPIFKWRESFPNCLMELKPLLTFPLCRIGLWIGDNFQ